MDKKQKKLLSPGFIIVEVVIIALSAFFAFGVVGYKTTALCLLALGAVNAVFRLLNCFDTKTARVFRIVVIVFICLGVIVFAVAEAFIIPASRTDKNPEAPYIIVLGAGVNGTVPSLSLLDRMEAALDYLETYPQSKAVLSGGQGEGEDITESECMRRWLTEKGINPSRLLTEDKSTSTQENITYSLSVIKADGGDASGRIAIATSEYHLYRAKFMLKEQGAEPLGVAGRTGLPFLRANYFIREAFAVVKLWIM